MKLEGIIRRMEMEIRAAQLIDNTWRDAETVEKELSDAMRVLLRFAYEAGQESAVPAAPQEPKCSSGR